MALILLIGFLTFTSILYGYKGIVIALPEMNSSIICKGFFNEKVQVCVLSLIMLVASMSWKQKQGTDQVLIT